MNWINNAQANGAAGLWQQNGAGFEGNQPQMFGGSAWGTPYAGGSDAVRPNWWNGGNDNSLTPGVPPWIIGEGMNGGTGSGQNGILSQIMTLLQQLVSGLGAGSYGQGGGGGGMSRYGDPDGDGDGRGMTIDPSAKTFQNVSLSSTGDPHLAVTGAMTNADGTTTNVNDHYDSMTGHRDLFHTNDFGDRFRVSTTASVPNANGVTTNATATATMNGGRDSVTMGQNGAVTVVSNGQAMTLGAGETVTLSGGEVVTGTVNGQVSISDQNAHGESMTTTFTSNGSGVDVAANASGGVTIGGDVIRHATSGI